MFGGNRAPPLVTGEDGGALASTAGVAGGAILGDGRVGLILDASGLVDLTEDNTSGQAAA